MQMQLVKSKFHKENRQLSKLLRQKDNLNQMQILQLNKNSTQELVSYSNKRD